MEYLHIYAKLYMSHLNKHRYARKERTSPKADTEHLCRLWRAMQEKDIRWEGVCRFMCVCACIIHTHSKKLVNLGEKKRFLHLLLVLEHNYVNILAINQLTNTQMRRKL